MKKAVLIFSLLLVGLGSEGWSQGPRRQIQTDAYNNRGTEFFQSITTHNAILPNIVYPYLPSGDALQNILASNVSSAPDIGAAEATIVFIAQTFQAKSGTGGSNVSGIWLWRIAVYMSFFGIMLSSWLIWQAVMQGKKGPGEAIVSVITKVVVVVALMTYVVPNVPPMLIGLTNRITDRIDDWFVGGNANMLRTIFDTKMGEAHSAGAALTANLVGAIRDSLPNERGQRIISRIQSDSQIKDALDGNNSKQWSDVQAIWKNGTGGNSIKEINSQISVFANAIPQTVVKRIQFHVDQEIGVGTGAAATAAGTTTAGDEEIKNQIGRALETVDVSSLVYPGRLLATYAYISFIYLAISIWGLGFGALIWTALYSLPEEWNLGGVLFAGVKGGIAVIIGVVLVTIYISAGVHYTDAEVNNTIARNTGNLWNFVSGVNSLFSLSGIATGAANLYETISGGLAAPGAFIGKMVGEWTGMTMDQFIIGMLILTAPAQAALLVKGGNGIAESAKNAMSAQGASSGSIGSMLGNWGGSSGVNAAGGGSVRGIMTQRNTSFMAPSKNSL
jgi:hypothetical protein